MASAVAIIFIHPGLNKKFVHCLTLYLIVAVQFHGVVSILQVVTVGILQWHCCGYTIGIKELEGLCACMQLLGSSVIVMLLLVIFWTFLYHVMVLELKAYQAVVLSHVKLDGVDILCGSNTVRRN